MDDRRFDFIRYDQMLTLNLLVYRPTGLPVTKERKNYKLTGFK